MTAQQTPRFNLPLLAVSHAQKEVTHNEALIRIDALLHAVIENRLSTPPALAACDSGKCWLVEEGASGSWSGRSGQLAVWTGDDWRYIPATDGMRLRLQPQNSDIVRSGDAWIDTPTIADPMGGVIIDVEARNAINTLLGYLRAIGHVTP